MPSLTKFNKMNNQFKYVVFGYARSIEKQLVHSSIPRYLLFLCLAYYYQDDYFYKPRDDSVISKDRKTAGGSHKGQAADKVYGKVFIDCGIKQIAKWVFRINDAERFIESDYPYTLGILFFVKNCQSVGVSVDMNPGYLKKSFISKKSQIFAHPEKSYFFITTGQEIEVTLDTDKGSFEIGDVGIFEIKSLSSLKFRRHCNCKIVLDFDTRDVSITMKTFELMTSN